MQDGHLFGEGSENGGYVPTSETEQELLQRMVDAGDFVVHVPYGTDPEPKVIFGDKRLRVTFKIPLPEGVLVPITYLPVKLTTQAGELLFEKDLPAMYGREPLVLVGGMEFDLHISLDKIDPEFVKSKMKTLGLTSRVGNMDLDDRKRKALFELEEGRRKVEENDRERLKLAFSFNPARKG